MHRRIPLSVGLEVTGDFKGQGTILEMSEGGLSFASDPMPAKGARIDLLITDDEARVRLTGEVVHAGERGGDNVAGVRFDPPDAPTLGAVKALLKRHRFNQFRLPR